MRLIRDTNGKVYAVQVGRLVVYVDNHRYPSLRHGGIMVTLRGHRMLAAHLGWRLSWVSRLELARYSAQKEPTP